MAEKPRIIDQEIHDPANRVVVNSDTRQVKAVTTRGVEALASEDTARAVFHERRRSRDLARDIRRNRVGNWVAGVGALAVVVTGVAIGVNHLSSSKNKQANPAADTRSLSPVGANLPVGQHSVDALKLPTSAPNHRG